MDLLDIDQKLKNNNFIKQSKVKQKDTYWFNILGLKIIGEIWWHSPFNFMQYTILKPSDRKNEGHDKSKLSS